MAHAYPVVPLCKMARGSILRKGPSVDDSMSRCHINLAPNFASSRFRCVCFLSATWEAVEGDKVVPSRASLTLRRRAQQVYWFKASRAFSQISPDEKLTKVWCDAVDCCCWFRSITKIEILISADLGRIMISKQIIDWTTVPSNEDAIDIR